MVRYPSSSTPCQNLTKLSHAGKRFAMKLTLSSKFDSNLRGFVPSQSLGISLFLPQRTFNDETTNCKFDRSNKAFFAITNARRFTFREKAGTLISRRFDAKKHSVAQFQRHAFATRLTWNASKTGDVMHQRL